MSKEYWAEQERIDQLAMQNAVMLLALKKIADMEGLDNMFHAVGIAKEALIEVTK